MTIRILESATSVTPAFRPGAYPDIHPPASSVTPEFSPGDEKWV